jgi:hypothetical protein
VAFAGAVFDSLTIARRNSVRNSMTPRFPEKSPSDIQYRRSLDGKSSSEASQTHSVVCRVGIADFSTAMRSASDSSASDIGEGANSEITHESVRKPEASYRL